MSINFNFDYTSLFGSLSSPKNSASSGSLFDQISLKDYASLKNGSYSQLTKAYYAKNNAGTKDVVASSVKDLNSLKTAATDLKKSSEKLSTSDADYDTLYKNVSSFVEDYNQMIKTGGDSQSDTVLRQTLNLTTLTSSHSGLLGRSGITIKADNTLSVDEETFKKTDLNTLKNIFTGANSYASSVSAKAGLLVSTSSQELKKDAGNLYDSYF